MFKKTRVSAAVYAAMGGALLLPAVQAQAQSTERIEITGSAIKRLDSETSLPVTVISRDAIARTGVTNMEQLVATISAASSAGNTTGSQLAGLATYGLSSISLRGLGEQRTLVLLNGRRLAVFAGGGSGGAVDINSIPVSAIERVEVLRDGASALYGSDAVAGVVNFILRKDYAGLEATINAGTPTATGGGQVNRANVLFGAGDLGTDKFNVMVGLDYENSRPLFAKNRDFAASGNQFPYFQNSATPSGRIEGIWDPTKSNNDNKRSSTNPFGITSSGYGNPFAPNNCAAINMFSVNAPGGVGGAFRNCNFDSAAYVGLFPKTERTTVFGAAKWALNADTLLYVEGTTSRTQLTEAYQPSPLRNAFLTTDTKFGDLSKPQTVPTALLVYPTNPAYQSIFVPYANANGLQAMVTSGLPVAVTLRTFLTGPRTEKDTNDQARFLAGIQGTAAGWDYDGALAFNQAKTSGTVIDGYFSQYALASVLSNKATNWNPWAAGGKQDPTVDAALQTTKYIGPTVSGKSGSVSADVTASRALGRLEGGDLQLALGAGTRKETYKIDVPAILGTGDIAGLGGATLPIDSSRTATAVFAEVNAPVLKSLELNGSVRFDRYSDVGSTTNGKASAKWKISPSALFRAAAGTGFRAPTLVELHNPVSTGSTEQFIDPANAADGLIQPNAILAGNPNLRPEKSKQFSLGFVVSPGYGLTASADIFNIKIDDYIIKPSALGLVVAARAGKPIYGPNDVTFNPDGTVDTVDQTLRNAASAKVQGVDINVNWAQPTAYGKLGIDLSGTYMDKFDLITLGGVQHSVGTIIQADTRVPLDVAALGVIARWRHTLTFSWSNGPWGATLAQNYNAAYQDADDLNGNPHRIPAVDTYDAQVSYAGIKGLKVAIGARNLLDKKPPIFIGNGVSFQYGYDPANFDPRGRFVYLNATYKFF